LAPTSTGSAAVTEKPERRLSKSCLTQDDLGNPEACSRIGIEKMSQSAKHPAGDLHQAAAHHDVAMRHHPDTAGHLDRGQHLGAKQHASVRLRRYFAAQKNSNAARPVAQT
jgi:hypothetical protein